MAGTLILCAGPIGNLSDAAPRLAEALSSADIVYAEDTRRAAILLQHLGVRVKTRSYFVGNESSRSAELGERLAAGETVALLTDAGTPGISDPGAAAVSAAIEAEAHITGVPGASAVTFAVALSGFDGDRFVFEGFLPRKGGARTDRLAEVAAELRTTVLFCSNRRLPDDLAGLVDAGAGERRVVIARELTKMHEELWRGTVAEAAAHWSEGARGEVTLVIEGGTPQEASLGDALVAVTRLQEAGASFADAVRQAAVETGVSRRVLYSEALEERGPS